jgi:hypothetical protein
VTLPVEKMVVFAEKYDDNGNEVVIWVSMAVERDLCSQGGTPVEAVQALQSMVEIEEKICKERDLALPPPTPPSVLRRVMGLNTGLLPNREFVRGRVAAMGQRPKMYAWSREAFLLQLMLLLEFADVEHAKLNTYAAASEVAGVGVADLQLEVDDVWAKRVVERTTELLG